MATTPFDMMAMAPETMGAEPPGAPRTARCENCRYWDGGSGGPPEMADYGRCNTISDGTNDEAFTVDGDKMCRANHSCSLWEARENEEMGGGLPPGGGGAAPGIAPGGGFGGPPTLS